MCREVRTPDGQTRLEPCSPGEKSAIAVTLTELAEQGMAVQVTSPDSLESASIHNHDTSHFNFFRRYLEVQELRTSTRYYLPADDQGPYLVSSSTCTVVLAWY